MKTKTFLFRFLIGFSAFSLGIGFFFVWQKVNVKTIAQSQTSLESSEKQTQETHLVETIDSLPSPNFDIPTEKDELRKYPFYPDGEFYPDGVLSEEFSDFNSFSIEANNWENASEENNYQPEAIVPKGFLLTNKKFEFEKINIGNRLVSFETEIKNGISYKFIGEYPNNENLNPEDEWVELKGTLTKYKNGKKSISQKMTFYVPGC